MQLKQPKTIQEYASNRSELLEQITQFLQEDNRFVAAWLTGSFGRSDADSVSDLDLTVVVENTFAKELCFRPHQVGATTTKERHALLSQFGQPHIIHENHHNAPPDGTFTFVLYKETGLAIDWVLRPNADKIARPALSQLLFDKVNISIELPTSVESLSQRIELATEQVAFFWMMVTVTIKYLIRRDEVYFHRFLDMLYGILWDVRRLVAGEPDRWLKGSLVKMATTRETQVAAVRQVCQEMVDVMRNVEKIGGSVPMSPMSTIEILIELAENDVNEAPS
jgi:hypothetical protein